VFVGNCSSTMASRVESVFQNRGMQNAVAFHCNKLASVSLSAQHMSVCDVTSRHVDKCPYVCCFCCKRFNTSTALLRHLKLHNSTVKSRKLTAFKAVTDKQIGCDMNSAAVKGLGSLICKDCNKQFRTRVKLKSHIRSKHNVAQHVCPHCDSRYKSACELRAHLRRSHTASASVNKYFCDTCGLCFGRSVDLRSHRLSHSTFQTCNGTATSTKSASNGRRSLRCKDCGADGFKTWRSVMLHRRTLHKGSLPHPCPHCPRRFLYASDLRKHERRHTGQRPHICSVCGKGFFHIADLEVHGRAHRGDAPLTCSVCNKWMSSMTGLRAHMHIHRPNAPLNVCTVCDKHFSYLSSLRAHMKRQHAGNMTKSDCWRCVECNVEFAAQSSLMDHVNSSHSSTGMALAFYSSSVLFCWHTFALFYYCFLGLLYTASFVKKVVYIYLTIFFDWCYIALLLFYYNVCVEN